MNRLFMFAAAIVLVSLFVAQFLAFGSKDDKKFVTPASDSTSGEVRPAPPPPPPPSPPPEVSPADDVAAGAGRGPAGSAGDPPQLPPGSVRLPGGVAAALSLNGPERLGRGVTGHVVVTLDRSVTEAVLDAASVVITGQPTLDTDTIATSTRMRARLESATLNPVALSPAEQRMFDVGPTRWDWTIRADQPGAHTATVTVHALLADGSEQQVQVYQHMVTVEVAWWVPLWEWILAHMEWVIGTLVLPFLWFAYRFWRARKLGLPPPE